MDKKKILICSVSFFPRISPRAIRTTELAKEFARQGHDVTVLTVRNRFDHEEFECDNSLKVQYFTDNNWQPKKANNMFKKIWYYCLLHLFMYPEILIVPKLKNALLNRTEYDLLISIAKPYPVHWGVAMALYSNKNLTKVWVADCGDPFTGNKENNSFIPPYFHLVEKWFCKKPDFITVPIKKAINAFPELCRSKIKIIPQGFNFAEVPNPRIVKNDIPTFAYAGTLSKTRDPKKFINFLYQYNTDFKFFVYTKNKSYLKPYIKILKEKLIIKDYIPRQQLLFELINMDFVVNFKNRYDVQSPSKLIDYALIKKPILSINCDQIDARLVVEFLNGDYSNSFEIQNMKQYDIKNVCAEFLHLINESNPKKQNRLFD